MAYSKDIGIRNIYIFYVKDSKERNKRFVDYKTFSKLLKDINLSIRYKIIYESEIFKIPYRVGSLYISKFKTVYNEDNKSSWRVNYKATKELGHVVYHGAPYGYKWKWNKSYKECLLNGKKWYSFKPCRAASRLIADAIINKQVDYYQ